MKLCVALIGLIMMTTSSITFACQCVPDVERHDCPCNVTIDEYIVQFDEIDRLQDETDSHEPGSAWIETLPYGWGEVLIDMIPALEPDYRRLDRARWQLEDEIFDNLGVIPPWYLAAEIDGRTSVYGYEPLPINCKSLGPFACGESLTFIGCDGVTFALGSLAAFLKNPVLGPNKAYEGQFVLFNVKTNERKRLKDPNP